MILALGITTKTGWAVGSPGKLPTSGSVRWKPRTFKAAATARCSLFRPELAAGVGAEHGVDWDVIYDVRGHFTEQQDGETSVLAPSRSETRAERREVNLAAHACASGPRRRL
jgi:hypothetical protein